MNITLGVYDLFTYAVPGSLYLVLLAYIAERLAWIDPLRILHANTTLVIIGGAILSYIIGHITYAVGYLLSRAYGHDKSITDAVNEFVDRVPAAQNRPYLQASRSVVQTAVEMHEVGVALEISRLRAVGLMLRNCAPVFVLGTIVAIIDAATGENLIIAGSCIVIFLLSALGCLSQSVVMRHWANMKTFELAFWVPDIDRSLGASSSPTRRSQHPHSPSPSEQAGNPTTSTSRRSKRQASGAGEPVN